MSTLRFTVSYDPTTKMVHVLPDSATSALLLELRESDPLRYGRVVAATDAVAAEINGGKVRTEPEPREATPPPGFHYPSSIAARLRAAFAELAPDEQVEVTIA